LLAGRERAAPYRRGGGLLYAADAAGRDALRRHLRAAPRDQAIHLLVDTAEEQLRSELLPRARGGDLRALIRRRQKKLFGGGDYFLCRRQGREPGAAGQHMLFACLGPGARPWAELLAECEAPLGGIHSVPLLLDALLKRLELEGANTPADLYLTVDLGRLYQAAQRGLLQPVDSPLLRERIPPAYRDPQGRWYGITLRARTIVYSRERVPAAELPGYLGLADRRWRGRLCVRSSANTYNQSLVAALIARYGAAEAERWARGLVANFARPPQGGDRDQIRAVSAELCDVALANTYYLGLMRHSGKARDAAAAQAVGVHWPAPGGVHVNLSGAGVVRHARHVPEALQLLEFLVRAKAQRWFTEVNYEYPVVSDVAPSPTLREWGEFAPDVDSLLLLGEHVQEAVKLMDRAGWR